jgi:hypothetical protein
MLPAWVSPYARHASIDRVRFDPIVCPPHSVICWKYSVGRGENEMDFESYKGSLAEEAPPEGLSMAAQALWWEAKGDWHLAHQCAQKQPDADGAWAHAYLHRVEGDLRNAGGWYSRAGRPASTAPLKEEWETIARALLG